MFSYGRPNKPGGWRMEIGEVARYTVPYRQIVKVEFFYTMG